MAISAVTNGTALNGINNMNKTSKVLDDLFEQLSSGKRINSAADDAAGLSISNRLSSQISGINQSIRNANDAIAMYQVGEGALQETSDSLQSMRSLAIESSNGTLTDTDRQSLQQNFDAYAANIEDTAQNTTYNGMQILNGSSAGEDISFHIGPNSGDVLTDTYSAGFGMDALVNASNAASTANVTTVTDESGGTYQSLSISTQTDAESSIGAIDSMISYVDSARSDMGAMQNRLESSINNMSNVSENLSDANSRISDTDFAEAVSNLAAASILEKVQTSLQTQANVKPKTALQLLQ